MTGNLAVTHELSFIGSTSKQSTTAASQTQVIVIGSQGPVMLLIMCTEDVHLRQGDGSVTATTSDFLLLKNTYIKVTMTTSNNSNIAYIRDSANGDIYFTIITDSTPN